MAQRGAALELVAQGERDERADRVVGGFGGDVDDAVHGVCAPQRRAGAADDLDALDVRHHDVVFSPLHTAEERRVDGAAVDQRQELVRRDVVETARAERDVALVDAADLDARGEPDRVGQIERPGAMDVLTGDGVDRGGGAEEGLFLAGGAGHADMQQVLQREFGDIDGLGGQRLRLQPNHHQAADQARAHALPRERGRNEV